MAKIASLPFNLTCVTLAFTTADEAATAFDAFTAEMVQWHASGVYPASADLKAAIVAAGRPAATAAVYASAILKWARSGKLPSSMNACVNKSPEGHVKGKAGRKAGQSAGKSPEAPNSGAAADPMAPQDAPSPMHRWVRELRDLNAAAFILRDAKNSTMSAEDANALKDAVSTCIALLGKYTT